MSYVDTFDSYSTVPIPYAYISPLYRQHHDQRFFIYVRGGKSGICGNQRLLRAPLQTLDSTTKTTKDEFAQANILVKRIAVQLL